MLDRQRETRPAGAHRKRNVRQMEIPAAHGEFAHTSAITDAASNATLPADSE